MSARNRLVALAACAALAVLEAAFVYSDEPRRIEIDDPLPYALPPIDYDADPDDPFARLARDLDAGRRSLDRRDPEAYLTSLLAALEVPVESQLLVFSKTAANVRQVAPDNPRAIYFNDVAYIGWVPGADVLELAGIDPVRGAIFYTLPLASDRPLRFERQRSCLTCHVSQSTLSIPGLMRRSLMTDAQGRPKVGYSAVDHDAGYLKRWGGWYVTGTPSAWPHSGNLFGEEAIERHRDDPAATAYRETLEGLFAPEKHLLPTSDVAAHLILDHQWHGQNLILRVHHEALLGRHSDVESRLVRYLLFLDEPPLPASIADSGISRRWFESRGPFDRAGRSLRQLNLSDRLLEYRCSWLIHSPSFAAMPAVVQLRLAQAMRTILSGESPDSEKLPAGERAAILEILAETKPLLFGKDRP